VIPYLAGGDLYSLLERQHRFAEAATCFYTGELVLALEYLHSENLIFRDIKPENILLDELGHIRVRTPLLSLFFLFFLSYIPLPYPSAATESEIADPHHALNI